MPATGPDDFRRNFEAVERAIGFKINDEQLTGEPLRRLVEMACDESSPLPWRLVCIRVLDEAISITVEDASLIVGILGCQNVSIVHACSKIIDPTHSSFQYPLAIQCEQVMSLLEDHGLHFMFLNVVRLLTPIFARFRVFDDSYQCPNEDLEARSCLLVSLRKRFKPHEVGSLARSPNESLRWLAVPYFAAIALDTKDGLSLQNDGAARTFALQCINLSVMDEMIPDWQEQREVCIQSLCVSRLLIATLLQEEESIQRLINSGDREIAWQAAQLAEHLLLPSLVPLMAQLSRTTAHTKLSWLLGKVLDRMAVRYVNGVDAIHDYQNHR